MARATVNDHNFLHKMEKLDLVDTRFQQDGARAAPQVKNVQIRYRIRQEFISHERPI